MEEIQFNIGTNPISNKNKSNFKLEQMSFHFRTFKEIPFHNGTNPITHLKDILFHFGINPISRDFIFLAKNK